MYDNVVFCVPTKHLISTLARISDKKHSALRDLQLPMPIPP